jgi:MFS family permease
MDRFGRKKIIIIKILATLVLLAVLIVLGLIGNVLKSVVIAIYFLSLIFSTFLFDIILLGFETLTKGYRDNYVILYSATRNLGIGLLCGLFYFLSDWAYVIIVIAGLLVISLILFIKFVYESPHHMLASTGNIDLLKYIINGIADVNDEEPLTDKIAFSHST